METKEKINTNPVKAIRSKCLDCCCGSSYEVRLYPCEDNCALWPFRFGKNPYRKKTEYTEEQLEALRERGREFRNKQFSNSQKGHDNG